MTTKEEFVKRYVTGVPSQYDKEKHIPLLFDVFSKGEGILAFCADALISQRTFHNWLHNYEDFKEAYEAALSIGGKIWEAYPIQIENLNPVYWTAIMRNRFGYNKSRFRFSPEKTPTTIIEDVLTGLENGEITAQEGRQVADLAMTKASIKANDIDNHDTSIKNTRSSVLKEIETIQKVIDFIESEK